MTKNCNFIDKLREAGLRPTKQRVKICEILFNREKTFHFTINDLAKKISEDLNEKISLATVYNTVHAIQKKGYLKEIAINSDKSYFDTNTTAHHHFYDEDTHELIDCDQSNIDSINVKNNITGKKINSVEVLIKVASDNQNHN
ncbi:transcriptional repressor [Candidatus Pelagibacter sp.]|jgi:Fur family iron response transcriptional regulator|uniref:Fur family transcriptional regulator n=1 Tax=uncultured Candidatus Pelagibacter sp. TaxID=372654 RepID=UPI0023248008|nr:transcriptional repressor [uncultured Candidatus Pelagibacter sp.]MDA7587606.1 transcriptional repressor [Candidatus Pelagibacter sp.]MDB3947214.1 transcriptional repressor [Candidatus Pelagibacter sp.]MDB3969967.1 transcriptional repressor [Candidatus Pelagibacter sp.]MDB4812383.1 transcriptional repressor [Candidatus Pelagibacter sp.]MDC0428894.1 transcriptional repressor [Candidatus Pelagibacter sp.]